MAKIKTGVNRLLIVRKKYVHPNLIEESGLKQFVKGDPLKLYPLYGWKPENGISHYGYLLEGLKLDDLDTLKAFADKHSSRTIIEFDEDKETALEGLARIGSLQVNPIA